jgi:hypothetical protein
VKMPRGVTGGGTRQPRVPGCLFVVGAVPISFTDDEFGPSAADRACLILSGRAVLTDTANGLSRKCRHEMSEKQAAPMAENRRANRRRVLKGGTIEFDRAAYSCTVRNLSDAGAALDVPYAVTVPHEFKLIIESNQASRDCRVIWRKENRLGVEFRHFGGTTI